MDFLNNLPTFIKNITIAAGLSGLVWILFDRIEKLTKPGSELKKSVSCWIRRDRGIDEKTMGWVEQSSNLLDKFFGKKHLSWKCFLLSSLVSWFSIVLISCLFSLLILDNTNIRFDVDSEDFIFAVNLLILCGIINTVVDYISLLESRVVIRYMKRSSSLVKGYFILVDTILSFTLFFIITLLLLVSLIYYARVFYLDDMAEFKSIFFQYFEFFNDVIFSPIQAINSGNERRLLLIPFISTFSTSVWLWIYGLSLLLMKSLNTLSVGATFLRRLDTDEQPFRILGLAAGTIVFVVTLLALSVSGLQ